MSISQAPEIGDTDAATGPPKKEGSAAPGRKPILFACDHRLKDATLPHADPYFPLKCKRARGTQLLDRGYPKIRISLRYSGLIAAARAASCRLDYVGNIRKK